MAGSGRPDRDAAKKSRACVPCHERKVRCNASLAGLPCNRCIESGRIGQCRLVSLPIDLLREVDGAIFSFQRKFSKCRQKTEKG